MFANIKSCECFAFFFAVSKYCRIFANVNGVVAIRHNISEEKILILSFLAVFLNIPPVAPTTLATGDFLCLQETL